MYLKKRYIEIFREMKNIESQVEIEVKFLEDFQIRVIEFYIFGFVEFEGGKIKLIDVGRKFFEIIDKFSFEEFLDVIVDIEIIKMMEFFEEMGKIFESWMEKFRERKFVDENGFIFFGKVFLEVYCEIYLVVYFMFEIVLFFRGMFKIGIFDEFVMYKNLKFYGDNIVNVFQVMRFFFILLLIEKGRVFVMILVVKLVFKVFNMILVFVRVIVFRKEDFEMFKVGKRNVEFESMGFVDEKGIIEFGKVIMDIYEVMGRVEEKVFLMYLFEDEFLVFKVIQEIEKKYEINLDIFLIEKEIERCVDVKDFGVILYFFESKEFIERRFVKEKDIYWLIEWGKEVINFGMVSLDVMKVVIYVESGDVFIVEWVFKVQEENVVKVGVIDKGRFYFRFSREIKRKFFIICYDVVIFVKILRKKYIYRDELVVFVQDYVGGDEKEIIRVIGEVEVKGFVVEFQNGMVKFIEFGDKVKIVIENVKFQEIVKVKFSVMLIFYNVFKVIYDNIEIFNRIWKEKGEVRDYKMEEVDVIRKYFSFSDDEIKKVLIMFREFGFFGIKSFIEVGKVFVEVYF